MTDVSFSDIVQVDVQRQEHVTQSTYGDNKYWVTLSLTLIGKNAQRSTINIHAPDAKQFTEASKELVPIRQGSEMIWHFINSDDVRFLFAPESNVPDAPTDTPTF